MSVVCTNGTDEGDAQIGNRRMTSRSTPKKKTAVRPGSRNGSPKEEGVPNRVAPINNTKLAARTLRAETFHGSRDTRQMAPRARRLTGPRRGPAGLTFAGGRFWKDIPFVGCVHFSVEIRGNLSYV